MENSEKSEYECYFKEVILLEFCLKFLTIYANGEQLLCNEYQTCNTSNSTKTVKFQ